MCTQAGLELRKILLCQSTRMHVWVCLFLLFVCLVVKEARKMASDLLRLELEIVMNFHVGARN